eukprot:g31242.t1
MSTRASRACWQSAGQTVLRPLTVTPRRWSVCDSSSPAVAHVRRRIGDRTEHSLRGTLLRRMAARGPVLAHFTCTLPGTTEPQAVLLSLRQRFRLLFRHPAAAEYQLPVKMRFTVTPASRLRLLTPLRVTELQ